MANLLSKRINFLSFLDNDYFDLRPARSFGLVGIIAVFFAGAVAWLLIVGLIYFEYPAIFYKLGMAPVGVGILIIGIACVILYIRTFRRLEISQDKLIIWHGKNKELEIDKNNLKEVEAKFGYMLEPFKEHYSLFDPAARGIFNANTQRVPITFELIDGRKESYFIRRLKVGPLSNVFVNSGYPKMRITQFKEKDISDVDWHKEPAVAGWKSKNVILWIVIGVICLIIKAIYEKYK